MIFYTIQEKANVVADALSRQGVFYGYNDGSRMKVIRIVKCFIHFSPEDRSVVSCAYMRVQPELFEVLKTQQLRDKKLAQILTDTFSK